LQGRRLRGESSGRSHSRGGLDRVGALIGSALILKGSLDRTAAEVGEVKGALGRLEAGAAPSRRSRAARASDPAGVTR
jgi:hypothetical protein